MVKFQNRIPLTDCVKGREYYKHTEFVHVCVCVCVFTYHVYVVYVYVVYVVETCAKMEAGCISVYVDC